MAEAKKTIMVNEFVDGIIDPDKKMLGPVRDGGHIMANTSPGCWGPMITPALKGGHEVTTRFMSRGPKSAIRSPSE